MGEPIDVPDQKMIEARIRKVADAITAALEAGNCELRAVPVILEDGRIGANVVIVPL